MPPININRCERLSVQGLRELAMTVSAEELRSLHLDQLPDTIPTTLVDEVPSENKEVIEDFIFDISMQGMDKLHRLEKVFGPEVHEVLTASSAMYASHAHRIFSERVDKLIRVFQSEKSKYSVDQIREYEQIKANSREYLVDLRKELAHVQSLLNFTVEQRATADPAYSDMLEMPAKELEKRVYGIQKLLNSYTHVCLCFSCKHMRYINHHVQSYEKKNQSVKQRIEKETALLEDLNSNMFTRRAKRAEINALKNSINDLIEESKAYETLISEELLLGWLDDFVESQLDQQVLRTTGRTVRQARILLFNLLSRYCDHQEDGAYLAAHSPFSQADPKKTISFMLKSEKFVLSYFEQKKSELNSWLGDAASKRLNNLGKLEKECISHLKKSKHLS